MAFVPLNTLQVVMRISLDNAINAPPCVCAAHGTMVVPLMAPMVVPLMAPMVVPLMAPMVVPLMAPMVVPLMAPWLCPHLPRDSAVMCPPATRK